MEDPGHKEKVFPKSDIQVFGIDEDNPEDLDRFEELTSLLRKHLRIENLPYFSTTFSPIKPEVSLIRQTNTGEDLKEKFDGTVIIFSQDFDKLLQDNNKSMAELSNNLPFKGGQYLFIQEAETSDHGVMAGRNDIKYEIKWPKGNS